MLPVFGRPYEGPKRHAVIGTRDLATGNMISNSSGGYCIERDVRLLRDPDAMKQHYQLPHFYADEQRIYLRFSHRTQEHIAAAASARQHSRWCEVT
jgi:hypothetical protein